MKQFSGLEVEFEDEEYSHVYLNELLNIYLATQIRVLREQRGWTQGALAERCGMKQEAISRLEQSDYGSWSIKTLECLARAFDVALFVSFEHFGETIRRMRELTRTRLQRTSRREELQGLEQLASQSSILGQLQKYSVRQHVYHAPTMLSVRSPGNVERIASARQRAHQPSVIQTYESTFH